MNEASRDPWVLSYDGFDAENEGLREALCALGNGVFVTRGAAEESVADGTHYPGTYLAGGYNRLESEIAGRKIVNEDLVNFPNWLLLTFRPQEGDWLTPSSVEFLSYRQELRLREGILFRRFTVRDAEGRQTTVESRRLVSMRTPHLAAIEYRITPENWEGTIRVRSLLDGSVSNVGVARYRQLNSKHLDVVETGPVEPEGVYLLSRTNQSRFEVAQAARTRLFLETAHLESEAAKAERLAAKRPEARRLEPERRLLSDEPLAIGEELAVEIRQGEAIRAEKVVALFSSRHRGMTEPAMDARLALERADDFAQLLDLHRLSWQALWRRFDLEIKGRNPTGEPLLREQLILRLHIFHLLQTVSLHTEGIDVSVPARGLHGEAYRGHIFWDELFILPFFNDRTPATTRSLLLYRYHRLEAARELARDAGYEGAVFPWQSSSDGREATQQVHLNPLSGRWDPDYSHLQRHVNAGVVYNVWQYYRATGDRTFLLSYGAEMVLEIARFWASIVSWNPERERFEINGVMGPDEYHEREPDADTGGLRNNAYTNVMAVWCLLRALDVLDVIGPARRSELIAVLGLHEGDFAHWQKITERMLVPFHGDALISQFEGYDDLEELDWEAYREKYGNVERLDRILKAEGDSPDRYKASKQADVDMLFYLLRREELKGIFKRLGYHLDDDIIRRNIEYYSARTSHGSTLSRVVYASTIHVLDADRGCRFFLDALRSDVDDLQRGTTAEGIHLGAMAGTIGILLRLYAGADPGPDGVGFEPNLPPLIDRLACRINWRGRWLDVELTRECLRLRADRDADEGIPVRVRGKRLRVDPGESIEVRM